MLKVILLSGQKQSGKTTFAKWACQLANVVEVSFAEPLKEVARSLLGMPASVVHGDEDARRAWKRFGKDGREWLQWIGTELGREQIDPDLWLRLAAVRIANLCREGGLEGIIISDARFKNELFTFENILAEELGRMAFSVVRVRITRPNLTFEDLHLSETEQLSIPDSEFHHVVVNDADSAQEFAIHKVTPLLCEHFSIGGL